MGWQQFAGSVVEVAGAVSTGPDPCHNETKVSGVTEPTRLQRLWSECAQSPWLDNIQRGWIIDGELQRWADRGVRGLTSNPSIFQKAISSTDDYDDEFHQAVSAGLDIEAAYWRLVTSDIAAAAAALRPVYDSSHGLDGFVSVEVAPALARDSSATVDAARDLHERLAAPNLYVKIPGTVEGLAAIAETIAAKRSVNVTLIFGLERYLAVADAYLEGLEHADGDLSTVSSVASFFVSRIDTEADRLLDEIGTPDALKLRGKTAIANAKVAYAHFCDIFNGPRWAPLAARGARPQRLLWASTSTKNPAYRDTLYVDELIGPHTVNTLPEATLEAFEDHGRVAATLTEGLNEAEDVLENIKTAGIDLAAVTAQLEHEGVAAFSKSFDELIETLTAKAEQRG